MSDTSDLDPISKINEAYNRGLKNNGFDKAVEWMLSQTKDVMEISRKYKDKSSHSKEDTSIPEGIEPGDE